MSLGNIFECSIVKSVKSIWQRGQKLQENAQIDRLDLTALQGKNYIFAAYADVIHTNIDIDLRYADIGHDIDSSYMILIMLIYLIL